MSISLTLVAVRNVRHYSVEQKPWVICFQESRSLAFEKRIESSFIEHKVILVRVLVERRILQNIRRPHQVSRGRGLT